MNKLNINIKLLSMLAVVLVILITAACKKEETYGPFDNISLDAVIQEAEALLENTQEGLDVGDQQQGSKKELQEIIDWAIWIKDNAKSEADISKAVTRLNIYIGVYKKSVVGVSIPKINQEDDTWIQISDNIKPVLAGEFTIEIQCYIVDLNVKGHSNNLFSSEQMNPDAGFAVRYYSDGNIQIVVGSNGWTDTGNQAGAGTMKPGVWTHVTMTNDGSLQILYINGIKIAENNRTHLPTTVDFPFVIGNSPQWTDRVCNTFVRELRVWNKVLNDATILANTTSTFSGNEDGLECYFPLNANLGSSFSDITGNYTATTKGNIEWLESVPVIELDYTAIYAAKAAVEAQMPVIEGTNNGDHPIGINDYLQTLIDKADEVIAISGGQDQLDNGAASIISSLEWALSMLIGNADGVFVDRDNPSAVGFRITPNYTPVGDYTVELEVNVKSLSGYGSGEFFNNGEFGIWVYGYKEATEDAILASGGLWNFTNSGNGWQGPSTESQIISPGIWKHVAIVHDNTARTTRIYVDGIERGIDSDIGAPNNSGWGEIWLGNGWGKMHGSIKNFRMWNETKTAGQLNASITGGEANLEIYFPLDKVEGIGFSDVTGNYNGEMRGISWNTD